LDKQFPTLEQYVSQITFSSWYLNMTRAELMRHALSQALRRVHIGPKKLKLDEETRWQIAGEAVEELRRYGGWKELDEEAPVRPLAKG